MTVVVIGSGHGSPGVTSLSIDLANVASRSTLLVDADPDGGQIAARTGLAIKPGMVELAGAARTGIAADDLWRYAQPMSRHGAAIVGHPSAEQMHAALRAASSHIAVALRRIDVDVVVDAGRLRPGSPAAAILGVADIVVLFCANSVGSILSATSRVQAMQAVSGDRRLIVVLSAAKPFRTAEIEHSLGAPVWGVLSMATTRRANGRRASAVERLRRDCFDRAGGEGLSPASP